MIIIRHINKSNSINHYKNKYNTILFNSLPNLVATNIGTWHWTWMLEFFSSTLSAIIVLYQCNSNYVTNKQLK